MSGNRTKSRGAGDFDIGATLALPAILHEENHLRAVVAISSDTERSSYGRGGLRHHRRKCAEVKQESFSFPGSKASENLPIPIRYYSPVRAGLMGDSGRSAR